MRPAVCQQCGASAFANLRPGVTRLREELEAAAGRPVVAVTGRDDEPPAAAGVYVGTEAVLHRVPRADVVAFLDIDAELLAPRYRAAEQAMALLVRGARLVGGREPTAGGCWCRRSCPATRSCRPRCSPTRAGSSSPSGPAAGCSGCRRSPPWPRSPAPGSDDVAAALRTIDGIDVGGGDGRYTARAATWDALGRALIAAPRPKGSRLRIEVDPPRQ